MIQTEYDIENLAVKYGFLPFFTCGIDGFSIEEMTPEYLWFSDEQDGPWEWKGPVIAMGSAAYGKFFRGKAGFVSLEWLPDLINYRRWKMKLKKTSPEKKILDVLIENESMMSNELKARCGYDAKPKEKISQIEKAYNRANKQKREPSLKARFDALINHLQMATLVCIADFEYNYTKTGKRYGWGRARYTTPELMYGEMEMPKCTPRQSLERMVNHLQQQLPDASPAAIKQLLK